LEGGHHGEEVRTKPYTSEEWPCILISIYRPKDVPVFNVTCSEKKRTTWSDILVMGKEIMYEYPFEAGLWYPDGQITTNKFWHTLTIIFCHWVPAYLIDFIMLLIGQKRL
jgi:alcohol-forming fatty acyl-CoA reductase